MYLCSMEEKKLLYTINNLGPEFITWEQPFNLSEVKRAALLNAERPMLIMAICCQYGILTELSSRKDPCLLWLSAANMVF